VKKLIGHMVSIVFDLPSTEWPIEGYPAFCVVIEVDMPMIEIKRQYAINQSVWINVGTIKTLRDQGICREGL
jgi:hypothetical protein